MSTITLDEQTLKSNRRFRKALVHMVEKKKKKCSPHHVLELQIRIIERQDKPIATIMPEDKWHALVTKRKKVSIFEKIESFAVNNMLVRLVCRFGFIVLFATVVVILFQIII